MRRFSLFFVLCLALCCCSLPALAATTITISETTVLTFPKIELPAPGNTTSIAINPLNNATSGTGHIISGTANRGIYDLSSQGVGAVSISVDITVTNSGAPGLTLNNFRGFYNGVSIDSFPSSTLAVPAKRPATTPLYIGATVTADSTVAAGSYTGEFTITVFVQ